MKGMVFGIDTLLSNNDYEWRRNTLIRMNGGEGNESGVEKEEKGTYLLVLARLMNESREEYTQICSKVLDLIYTTSS